MTAGNNRINSGAYDYTSAYNNCTSLERGGKREKGGERKLKYFKIILSHLISVFILLSHHYGSKLIGFIHLQDTCNLCKQVKCD